MSDFGNLTDKKILVTGGSGFLGTYVVSELQKQGARLENILVPRSVDCDLRDRKNCELVTTNQDMVIHLAGNVGGIGKNRALPGTLFYDNAVMGIELMEAARKNKVKKFVCVSTICAYPKHTPVPFREVDFWNGYPEETNAPYGLAKKMLLVQAQAYREQFGFNAIYLLPVNMYGPRDNFDLESSHVIPALVRKIIEAKEQGKKSIEIWGNGTPTREFLYVEDAARAIVMAAINYDKSEPINLGTGQAITIKDLVALLFELLDYKGEIKWNDLRPNGQPKRLLDVSRAQTEFGFKAEINLRSGLEKTIAWYLSNR